MKLLISLILFSLAFNLIAQKLELKTNGERITFEVGETVNLKLTLLDVNGNLSIESKENNTVIDLRELKKEITIVFDKEGRYTIGPYEINLGNKKITSNSLKVDIVTSSSSMPIQDTLIEIIASNSIIKGEDFEILIKSNVKLDSLQIQETKFIKPIASSTSSSFNYKNGKSTSQFIYRFKLNALKKGDVTINFKSFIPNISDKVGQKTIRII